MRSFDISGKSELKRSAVADNVSGTSSGMFIAKEKDTIVAGIEAKISTWTFFPKAPLAPTMLLSGSWCLSTIGRQRHD
ncbi:hypothetical protein V6N11_029678 [Hibiscus sabdariffa]|uniref:Uncharacterized protein n=2 Tax=Hibiscus sabdariffa TaxID=183260 RepID=A0ABR2A577_9ROSI